MDRRKTLNLTTLFLMAAGIVCASHAMAAERPVRLFILSGQSNMVGINPDIAFTPTIKAAFPHDEIVVVKDAVDGQPIRRWDKAWRSVDGDCPAGTGELYDGLIANVRRAIDKKKPLSLCFIWMQGERDARLAFGEVYAASFQRLIGQIRKDLGRDDLAFVIGRLSDFDNENKRYPHWTMVREAQVRIAEQDPFGAWINTDDLNGERNDLHYPKEGYRQLGKRFAERAIELLSSRDRKDRSSAQ